MAWIENRFEQNFIITTVDQIFNWAQEVVPLATHLRSGLLRHRDDCFHHLAF